MMAYWLEEFEPLARSLGIYACREVRGASSLSMHACGRATDLAVPVDAAGHAVAYEFLRRVANHPSRLGVQYVIFNRTHWSAVRDPAGEPYRGVHPHYDHIHLELTPAAASKLTLATIREVLGSSVTVPVPPPSPEGVLDVLPVLNFSRVTRSSSTWVGSRAKPNNNVRALQGLLAALGAYSGNLDGIGGPLTKAAVGTVQARFATGRPSSPSVPDYVVGDKTWRAALRVQ